MTKVINIFGAPGCGKSTLASEFFSLMKKTGEDIELVNEYVKSWAWLGRQVGTYDQLYLLGKQTHYESRLYNKVNYLVTDSPVLLCPFYELEYFNTQMTKHAALEFVRIAKINSVEHYNFWLPNVRPYNPKGRYQSEDENRVLETHLYQYLKEQLNLDLTTIPVVQTDPVKFIYYDVLYSVNKPLS